jgi:ATP-dependent Clp protease adaptor protein ClpS
MLVKVRNSIFVEANLKMSSTVIKEKEKIEISVDSIDDTESSLILFNDDYHTFDFVIKALIEVCKHTPTQAEQCTMIVHYKGRCDVKHGAYDELKPMKEALIDRELQATID